MSTVRSPHVSSAGSLKDVQVARTVHCTGTVFCENVPGLARMKYVSVWVNLLTRVAMVDGCVDMHAWV